ncbi:hypothetical protein Aperf_G00000114143 [Anoplocephala perfoliata]
MFSCLAFFLHSPPPSASFFSILQHTPPSCVPPPNSALCCVNTAATCPSLPHCEAERNNGTNYPMGIDRAEGMREHHYLTERETLSAPEVSSASPLDPARPPPRSAGHTPPSCVPPPNSALYCVNTTATCIQKEHRVEKIDWEMYEIQKSNKPRHSVRKATSC